MKLTHFVTSQEHPALVLGACLSGIAFVTVAVLIEARRRHVQRKKYEQKCLYCSGNDLVFRYVRVRLSPDLTGNFLTKVLSEMDYLCQTQAMCSNPLCTHRCLEEWDTVKKGANMPFAVNIGEIKHWRFKNRLFRFRELRRTFTSDQLISNGYIRIVLRERGLKVEPAKTPVPFEKPSLPTLPGPFPDISAAGFRSLHLRQERPERQPKPPGKWQRK